MIVSLVFRYFAFIAFAVNVIRLFMLYPRVSRPVFIFSALLTAVFLMWGVFQVIGHYSSWAFVFSAPFSDPLVALFWILYFLFVWGITAWVVWGNGAACLAESGIIQGPGMSHPLGVKIFFVGFSVLFPFAVWLMHTSGAFADLAF